MEPTIVYSLALYLVNIPGDRLVYLKNSISSQRAIGAGTGKTSRVYKEDIIEVVADRSVGVAGDNAINLREVMNNLFLDIKTILSAMAEANFEARNLDHLLSR